MNRFVKREAGKFFRRKTRELLDNFRVGPPDSWKGQTVDVVQFNAITGKVSDIRMYDVTNSGKLKDVTPPWDEDVKGLWDDPPELDVIDGESRLRRSPSATRSRGHLRSIQGGLK